MTRLFVAALLAGVVASPVAGADPCASVAG